MASVAAPAREVLSVRIALGVIGVAVLDDAFAHPEPGTSARDHLISGLVPVAVAVAAGALYPRLRQGGRAAVELVCGMLALVAGVVDGVRHMAVAGLAGDDVTVLVAGLAGAALLV